MIDLTLLKTVCDQLKLDFPIITGISQDNRESLKVIIGCSNKDCPIEPIVSRFKEHWLVPTTHFLSNGTVQQLSITLQPKVPFDFYSLEKTFAEFASKFCEGFTGISLFVNNEDLDEPDLCSVDMRILGENLPLPSEEDVSAFVTKNISDLLLPSATSIRTVSNGIEIGVYYNDIEVKKPSSSKKRKISSKKMLKKSKKICV